jgi:imidazole glycerol-phosphate synthase subunit HisH
MIAIVSYGSGNVAAISNIYNQLRIPHVVAADAATIDGADRYVLPGVGHFGRTMATINASGVFESLRENVIGRGKPLLGICVGMQVLAERGDEGNCQGLGWVEGQVHQMRPQGSSVRMPHMGWNSVSVQSDPRGLLKGIDEGVGFYFLHSYCFVPKASSAIVATSDYGVTFACAVWNGANVFGVQFHPEKSHRNGMLVFQNFAALQ